MNEDRSEGGAGNERGRIESGASERSEGPSRGEGGPGNATVPCGEYANYSLRHTVDRIPIWQPNAN